LQRNDQRAFRSHQVKPDSSRFCLTAIVNFGYGRGEALWTNHQRILKRRGRYWFARHIAQRLSALYAGSRDILILMAAMGARLHLLAFLKAYLRPVSFGDASNLL
jgi:hypothetical protein